MSVLSDDVIEVRKAIWEMFEGHSWHYFLTFAYKRKIPMADAKKVIGVWLQHMDRKKLGPQFKKHPSDRAKLMGLFEHPNTNIHLHALFYPPRCKPDMTREEIETLGNQFWKKLMPSGDLEVSRIYDQEGARKYLTKEVFEWDHLDRLVTWKEFWVD